MAGGRVLTGTGTGPAPNVSNISILLQNQTTGRGNSEQPLDSLFLPTTPAPFFAGSRSMMSFKDVQGGNKGCSNSRSFFRAFDLDESCDDGMDEYFHQPEKKRRLSAEQVQFLEKSFEVENKLEPDRKTKIAKDLGLQPRQVAIWFQNRRARWKTKQLEKDYDSLHASFESLKTNHDNLLKEKDRLKAEVESLTEKVLAREKQGGKLFNIQQAELSETNGLQEQEPLPQKPLLDNTSVSEGEGSKVSVGGCNKQEDISSGCRSDDIMDSDSSPRYRDGGVHSASALLETGDNSSYVFEPDQSDMSQDEEDNLSRTLLHPYLFPKLGDDHHDVNYSESSSSFGFPEEDDHALWPWSY